MTLEVGEVAPLVAQFTNENGVAADPTTVTLTITAPDGTVTTVTSPDPSLINAPVGTWAYDLTVTQAGVWVFRFQGTGAVVAGETDVLTVLPVGAGRFLPDEGPCEPWCDWADVTRCAGRDLSSIDDAADQAFLIEWASGILFDLSGRRYPGVCSTTISLCTACGLCNCDPCRCVRRDRVDLGRWPVDSVSQVIIDGDVLATSSYHVADWRWLVRDDGQTWPRGTDIDDEDAFTVTFTYGRAVPRGGARAAAVLAAEAAAECVANGCSNLPQRVTQVNREGITFTVLDSLRFLEDGRTGVYAVDLWLIAEQRGRKAPPAMLDPADCAKHQVIVSGS